VSILLFAMLAAKGSVQIPIHGTSVNLTPGFFLSIFIKIEVP